MRPGGVQRWEQVVVSLQSVLRVPVAVGGRTALDRQGHAHYLALGGNETIRLYAESSLPHWLTKLKLRNVFETHNAAKHFPTGDVAKGIASLPDLSDGGVVDVKTAWSGGLKTMPWGQHSSPILVSAPERAMSDIYRRQVALLVEPLPFFIYNRNQRGSTQGSGAASPPYRKPYLNKFAR